MGIDEISVVDDIESIAYLLAEIVTGKLLWNEIDSKQHSTRNRLILEAKTEKYSIDEICGHNKSA